MASLKDLGKAKEQSRCNRVSLPNLHMEKAQEQPFEKESMEDLEAHMPIGGESYRKANTKVTSKRLIQPSVFGIFNNKSKDKETSWAEQSHTQVFL